MGAKRRVEILAVAALLGILAVLGGGLLYLHQVSRELLRAAVRGDAGAVRSLLARGASVRARTRNGETPLLLAARRGSEEIVRLLLERGADPNAKDRAGYTALWWVAARDGAMPNRSALAHLLLKNGADPNVAGKITGGATPLSWAAAKGDAELVRVLLRHGADVNLRYRFGGTTLGSARRAAAIRTASRERILKLSITAPPAHRAGLKDLARAELQKRREAERAVRMLLQAGIVR